MPPAPASSFLITSPPLLAELAEVLARNKFAERIRQAKLSPRMLLEDYAIISYTIEPTELPEPVSRDPDDDEVIACALAAEVDAIVSGDGDLLTLGTIGGFRFSLRLRRWECCNIKVVSKGATDRRSSTAQMSLQLHQGPPLACWSAAGSMTSTHAVKSPG